MKTKSSIFVLLIIAQGMMFSACSGGGSGNGNSDNGDTNSNTSQPPGETGNWDSFSWDQNNWG